MKKVVKRIFQIPFLEKVIACLSEDKSPDHFFARLPAYCDFYSENSLRIVKRKGIFYELDLSDYMEWLVFYGIKVEPREKLYSLARPGHIVLDIGSNIGEVAFNLAQRVGNGGHVYAFEPDPVTFRKIIRNFEMNTFSNLTLNNVGLGEKSIRVTMAPEIKRNRGGVRVCNARHPEGISLPFVALDDWMRSSGDFKVNLIKIDVEGYELKVLKGAKKVLKRSKPILFIELNDENLRAQGNSASELIGFLCDAGYSRIQHADTGGNIGIMNDFTSCHYDIIAQ